MLALGTHKLERPPLSKKQSIRRLLMSPVSQKWVKMYIILDQQWGYQPLSSYHVPPRNIIREGDRFVTFEQRPDSGISNANNKDGKGGSSYGFNQTMRAFNQFKRPEQTPVYDPRAYKDVHYDQDAELEKLWKHISANNSRGSKPNP